MTITPMAPMPALGTDPAAPAAAPDGAGAETFGALIAAQLGRLAEPAAPGPQAVTSDARAEDEAEDEVTLPDQAGPATMPCAPSQMVLAAAPGLAVAAVAAGPVPALTPSPLVADAPTDGEAEVAAVDGRPTGEHGRPAEAVGYTVVLPAGAAAQLPAHPGGGEATGAGDAPVGAELPVPAPTSPDATTAVAAAVPTTETPSAVLPVAPTTPTVVTPVVTPLVATVPVVTPDPSAVPAPANPVVDQVAPMFTRMVSGPEGQHRMMLRLHPADLGEVHLTVTVRGDSVDVTVAATPEARELLTEGSSELKSLLDSVGRTADRLVFRDLPGTGTTVQVISTGTGGAHPDGQPAAQSQAGSGESGRSGQHGRDDLGRHHATGAPQDSEVDRRTSTTTTTNRTHADGLVRGGLDVRM